jgi:hypothetical protein
MSTFEDSDLFVINRGGVNYKVTYLDLVTGNGINATDLLMLQRGDVQYSIEYQQLGQASHPVQPNDFFQVQRGDEMYAAEATGALSTVPNMSISCDTNVADNGSYVKINYFNARGYNGQPAQIRNAYTRDVFYIAGTGTAIVPKSFVTAGGYTIRLYGQFDSFNFSGSKGLKTVTISTFNAADYDLLLPNPSSSFGAQMFLGCSALTAIDTRMPVKSLRQFLRLATSFNGYIGGFSTASVTDFTDCFSGCTAFNQAAVSTWDMSSAQYITGMFQDCVIFNKDLNVWGPTLTNVVGASKLFSGASLYDQPMDTWETGTFAAIGGFDEMFKNATNFSQDLSGWCVSQIGYTPYNFSVGSSLTAAQLPVWGTCP